MGLTTLIGYFTEKTEAQLAFKGLAGKGCRRLVLLSKNADSEVQQTAPFLSRYAYFLIVAAIFCGVLAWSTPPLFRWYNLIERQEFYGLPFHLGGSAFALLAILIWLQRFSNCVEKTILQEHARWLIPGESVVILQASPESLKRLVIFLRESNTIPPQLFIQHPSYERRSATRTPGVRFTLTQLTRHAFRYARRQTTAPKLRSGVELLRRLKQSGKWVERACSDLSAAKRLEQKATPAADWILDNEYILERNVRDVLRNLPKRFFLKLPVLAADPYRGMPYIYGLAKDFVAHTDQYLDRDNILVFLDACQDERVLSIGELWAIPQMIRIALIESIHNMVIIALGDLRERQLADFWANRLITANQQDSNTLFAVLAELSKKEFLPSPYFSSQLVGLLYDEPSVLSPVRDWLERVHKKPLHDLNIREQKRQTCEQVSCGNAFTSLRQLTMLDWREMFEKLSRVEQILRNEPRGVYSMMDFATRDRCRQAVEELAYNSAQAEEHIAERVVELAARSLQESADDDLRNYVSSWLIGEGRRELAGLISCRESLRHRILAWTYRHHTSVYFAFVGSTLTALVTAIVGFSLHSGFMVTSWSQTMIGLGCIVLALVVPVSQLAIEVVNYVVTRFLPPRSLAKMDFKKTGIPDEFRTLVVVPVMLADAGTVDAEVEKLEIRYLANKETNLFFSLFSDYTDADTATRPADASLLARAIEAVATLNQRYGDERFFLFHRERTWSESEQKYIGWERKRGKLEELNNLIDGSRPENAPSLVYIGNEQQLADIRFVITLDSDTRLPHSTARKMVETLAHPLNQPRFDSEGRIAAGSYTIIQPRVSPTLESSSASLFSRLFSDPVGIDPYTAAVSDVYQDLSGEGSYQGKGIYDVRAFARALSGRFPAERILSHDLIEGAYVRVGLASDIELYDDFPAHYQVYSNRSHRWIRGDWQIATWMLPRVPLAGGDHARNPLSALNRWKIFDNLRRSLVPFANIVFLVLAWSVSPQMAGLAALVVCSQLIFHAVSHNFTMATSGKSLRLFSLSKLIHDLLRAFADAAFLPGQAAVSLDAAIRATFRTKISGRHMLEWTTGATVCSVSSWKSLFALTLSLGSIASVVLGVAVWQVAPGSLAPSVPWLVLWFFAPVLGWLLNRKVVDKQKSFRVSERDIRFLRMVSRRTWRYFSSFVNTDTNWLPPDNYQVAHQDQLAMRTSPTNIGLYMTSVLGAYDSGYLTINQVVDKLTSTMATIRQLQRYRGHLLNWYDISTLQPLEPRYVSTVDSGNLLGCLWALGHGLEEIVQFPLLESRALAGIADTIGIVQADSVKPAMYSDLENILTQFLVKEQAAPADILAILGMQRAIEAKISSVAGISATSGWEYELQQQIEAWAVGSSRYLSWLEILSEKTEEELAVLGSEALSAIRHDLQTAPSLAALAGGKIGSINIVNKLRASTVELSAELAGWLDRVAEAFATSQWLAGETLAQIERLITEIRELSEEMQMGFLYDSGHKLFSIGYNVSTSCLDGSRYDLLASEARFGSFVAIARGDVSLEHWFALGRLYGAVGGKRVLLSWTGTMFEYLMPLLFQRTYVNSLLDKAAREAVGIQVAYGRKHRVPWGISESAFANLDLNKTYQYKAFGVSALGLKQGSEEQLVVSPYATLLALNVVPTEAVKNLQRMSAIGLLGDYGYYESIDYSRKTEREGGRGVVIEAYMAHHQGMAFLALTNFLYNQPFSRRFHSDSRVQAFEALLQERIPSLPPLHLAEAIHREPVLLLEDLTSPAGTIFTSPHTPWPRSLLLSNGRYGLMVTNNGGGYSQLGDQELTRWRAYQTSDSMGIFCYIHEVDRDRLWSATYHPVGGEVEGYSAEFTLDRAVFRRVNEDLHTEVEVIVSQEDDAELRRITFINHSSRERILDLTSYVELSMAPHNADLQHPAFNKLFIQTEALPEQQVLLAYRRLRSEHDHPLVVAHRLLVHHNGDEFSYQPNWQFETDRGQFVGRGHTLANPMGARRDLGENQGFVLDPVMSVRQSLTLKPEERAQVTLILVAGSTREEVLLLIDKYSDSHAIERAMNFAWRAAQQQLQVLQIQPDEARRFQQLAGHLLFPRQRLRAPAKRLAENRKGQSGLWPYGISGDLPLVLVMIGDVRDLSLIRQMLQAHTYWRMQGFATDLLIVNEESGGYQRPLQERLEQMIQVYALAAAADRGGNVYLQHAPQVPESDLKLFTATASVVLLAARGTLPQQLGRPIEVAVQLMKLPRKSALQEPSAPLPFLELHYFNSLGGFTQDGSEYAIYLGPNINTPAPWVNVIANPMFGTLVSETGSGFTWFGNSQRNRLTGWSNDPVIDPPSEAVYIRDEETGEFWSPTAAPIRQESAYRARHGAGYTVFEHNSSSIEQELTVFVPVNDDGGEPVKMQRLKLTNSSSRPRKLSVTYYVELTLGENRETSWMHTVTEWDEDTHAVLARNYYHPEYPERITFASISPRAESYGCDRHHFVGRNRSLANPAAMEQVQLSERSGAGLDPCAALRVTVEIRPGEVRYISCLLGQAGTIEQARELLERFQNDDAFTVAFNETRSWWNRLLGTIAVQTPELGVNLLVNRWLQYQTLSCRIWGRSGFYQSGGAFGFRDQLQDVMAFLAVRPEIAREQILLSASRQFQEGDVQHWWHEPSGAGIRSRISDDLLWLPYVVAEYVRATGDSDILAVEVPFIHAPELEDDQYELFIVPEVTSERASIFEHCRRAVSRGLTVSSLHGLPLIGTGDWNDGMNLVGAKGKGESVWLAWFLCDVLERMAELSISVERIELREDYLTKREKLIHLIEKEAWDGQWYLRGTFDDGSLLGSATNSEAKIDSLPQSWAWLSGAADPTRANEAIESAWEHLVHEDERVVQLFKPPFESADPSPGYIKGYPPGVRENGGQYTHAALWMAMAMARKGDGERAAKLLRLQNPIEHARDAEAVWRYRVEPYVVAADVYRLPGKIGQGGWSWYTGSASWMYRAWIEEVLGVQIRNGELRIHPVFPDSWDGFSVRLRYGEAIYDIKVENSHGCGCGVESLEIDGKVQTEATLCLEKDPIKHRIIVKMADHQQSHLHAGKLAEVL
ncbi:GH36-type glycosyl hydrolase domain-containing protein [Desulfopila sp. IMCC35008]|uniref:GH36-type glycosyl hydrolase domain-containing protein n=1 Tax=Desulfopila sp. IMCC35008 TaxID=2653858 RepID=UPI0013CF831C|nr:glucoamylase family protein [Desulfopila sp. IMCC35008]